MRYISTRGRVAPLSFSEAVMSGLAADGGLLLPENIPQVDADFGAGLRYADLAYELMRLYTDLPEDDLRTIVERSYATFDSTPVVPLKRVGELYIMELFHGPTLAFKDVALQFLGNLFEYLLERDSGHMNIVAATSGDTGSAAIQGVRGKARINIFVMHPDGRTSLMQKLQMTTVLDDNVFNLAVDGTFDDCQAMLKEIFGDADFKQRYALGAVNSINWARVLAQVVYYIYAAGQVRRETGAERVRFSVPTGNFGDIFAGYIAAKMGVPIDRLVLATNANDILARFFARGEYRRGSVVPTISPSMDIQVASNFERYLYYRLGHDSSAVCDLMERFAAGEAINVGQAGGVVDSLIAAESGSSEDNLQAIRECYEAHGYLLDPHSALGWMAGRRHLDPEIPMVCLATAHPAKFGDAIQQALGRNIANHQLLDGLENSPTRCDRISASVDELKQYISNKIKL